MPTGFGGFKSSSVDRRLRRWNQGHANWFWQVHEFFVCWIPTFSYSLYMMATLSTLHNKHFLGLTYYAPKITVMPSCMSLTLDEPTMEFQEVALEPLNLLTC